MSNTFNGKIRDVPMTLVQQGWRLQPDDSVLDAWTDSDESHRWEDFYVGSLHIVRPVKAISEFSPLCERSLTVYAHQGWGEGLAPTPELVDVWPYWWAMRANKVRYPATVFTLLNVVVDVHADHIFPVVEWLGPVLPQIGLE